LDSFILLMHATWFRVLVHVPILPLYLHLGLLPISVGLKFLRIPRYPHALPKVIIVVFDIYVQLWSIHCSWNKVLFCISSHVKRLIRIVGVVEATHMVCGRARWVLMGGIYVNRWCHVSCSSCIHAKLMASLRDCGLNIPTNTICIHPRTLLSSFSNSH